MPGRPVTRSLVVATALATVLLPSSTAGSAAVVVARAPVPALVRVDSLGYLPHDVKQGYVMTTRAADDMVFRVVDSAGHLVQRGTVPATSSGRWNATYTHVYRFALAPLTRPGTYRVTVAGGAVGASPTFRVAGPDELYGRLVRDGVRFFQVQRDGPDQVPGPLHRRPSHLNDSHATLYEQPIFTDPDSDTIVGPDLAPVTGVGPVDALGGWFDAGDYLKLTHTTAYGDVLLYASARALGPRAPASLVAEARYGERYLERMWNPRTGRLLIQVGIGSGNEAGTFLGDHDLWRLPEVDDADRRFADRYAAAHRPVFEAAPAGGRISPNVAGRVSAAFALAAQADAHSRPGRARDELWLATSMYAHAATTHVPDPLVTALPEAFYPESTWLDDMELGATEIALARHALGRDDRPYLRQAAHWAAAYLATSTGDTFNLYDTSALAHTDLVRAIRLAGSPPGLAISPGALVADLRRQVDAGVAHAQADVFGAAGDATDFDVDSHTFGWIASAAMYDEVTGTHRFRDFAAQQRGWLFGANAWGASFMVGEGTNYPRCMQHQVANLSGSLDGSPPLVVGAVVNGPNSPSQFDGGLGGLLTGMRRCPDGPDPYRAFTGHGARFVDDVRAWQTAEPALDMTGAAVIAAAYQLAFG